MVRELLLTYIVPVYNTGQYVLRCLQSIVEQGIDSSEYEVLVVDDGSTDDSRTRVEAFAGEHPQVRMLCQENGGVSSARNLALDNARGRYIQFVDSDDHLMPGNMASLLHRAVNERFDVLIFNYRNEDASGLELPVARNDNYDSTSVVSGHDYLESHAMTPYVWRFLIRRAYLENGCAYMGDGTGWRFDPSLIVCEDGALIARFLLAAARVAHDGAYVYCYVNRDDSAMHNTDLSHISNRLFSQVDAAASIDQTIKSYEQHTGKSAPASVAGVRNVYLYFSMTKALTCGLVDEVLHRIRHYGLYPFPCVGPEANYHGKKWKWIHSLMMHPRLWLFLSKVYRIFKN